jgi:CHAT domain-containing protein
MTSDGATLTRLASMPAGDRRRWVASRTAPEPLVLALAEEAETLVNEDLARALEATELLVQLSDELGLPEARARSRRARGQALAYASRYNDALRILAEAQGLARARGLSVEAARCQLASLHALAKLGRLDDAAEAGETARAALVAEGEDALAGRADINLGVTHRMRDEPERALHHFDRARAVLAHDTVMVAQLDSNRAEALLDLGRFDQAQRAFEESLRAFRELGMPRAEAVVEGNLGDLMARQGRLDGAVGHLERARRHLEAAASPGEVARIQAEQADAFAAAGLLAEARAAYEAAIAVLDAQGMSWEASRARVGLGSVLRSLGARVQAEAVLHEAETGFRRLGHRTGRARALGMRGELALEASEPDRARRLLGKAVQLVQERPQERALAEFSLARLEVEAGENEAAERLDRLVGETEHLGLQQVRVDALRLRAVLARRHGRSGEAIADLRAAADLFERGRGRFPVGRFRLAFAASRAGVYEELLGALLADAPGPDAPSVLELAERAKSRSLLDLVHGRIELLEHARGKARDEAERSLLDAIVGERVRLQALQTRMEALAPDDVAHRGDLAAQLERVDVTLQRLEAQLGSTAGLASLAPPAIDAAAILRSLAPDEALLEYMVADGQLLAIVARGGRIEVRPGLAPIEWVEQAVAGVHFQMARALARHGRGLEVDDGLEIDLREELREIHDRIVAPARDVIGDARRLLVVPHGPLHGLPFHALHDGADYLVGRWSFRYGPSASVVADLQPRRAVGPGTALVTGVPDETLPRLEDELEAVCAALPGANRLDGDEACAEQVLAEAAVASLVHLACHGRFLPRTPLASGVRVADRWLTVRDLSGLDLHGALVTLSACETGRHLVESGDEPLGLARALLAAGASSVIVSLWSVEDESAAFVMASLYRDTQSGHWSDDGVVADRLRAVQLEAARKRTHPAFWSPFVVIGRG